ncbi:MAG TPA: S4 domain-containing protein [Acidimicrobiales bacterium]|nr:S4 domain-containing protein [Acidimicrobiales bacterium]
MEHVRVDQWLWATRVFRTRAAATSACRAGHVRVNGTVVKAAAKVRPGDRVAARVRGAERTLEVVALVAKRIGAEQAAGCLVDHTPATPREAAPFARTRGTGRPTKRDRRRLDRLQD